MCDDIFYRGLNVEEDERWSEQCQSTAKLDVTSIVDALENGQKHKLLTNVDDISGRLVKDVEQIERWVDGTLNPALFRVKKDDILIEIKTKLGYLAKRLNEIHTQVPKNDPERQKSYNYKCSTCKKAVRILDKNSITYIEEHLHMSGLKNMQSSTENESEPIDSSSESISSASTSRSSYPEPSSSECSNTPPNKILIPPFFELNKYTRILYPNALINRQISAQNHHMLTLQKFKPTAIRCLVCGKDFYNEIFAIRHLSTKIHTEALSSKIYFDKLKGYHLLFNPTDNKVTVHAPVFIPNAQGKCYTCKVCRTLIPDANIVEHINGSRHRKALLENQSIKKYYFYVEMLASLGLSDLPKQNNIKPIKSVLVEGQNKSSDSNSHSKNVDNKESSSDSVKSKLKNPKINGTNTSSSSENVPQKKEHQITLSIIENPADIFQSLEIRLQEHNKLFLVVANSALCTVCKLALPLSRPEIKSHVISTNHLKLSRKDVVHKRWSYYCDLCSWFEHSELKWEAHFQNIAHKQR